MSAHSREPWRSSALTDPDRVSETLRQLAQAAAGAGGGESLTVAVNVFTLASSDGVKKFLSADSRRRGAFVKNRASSASAIYLGTNTGLDATKGIEVVAGNFFKFAGTNDWWLFTPTSAVVEVATIGV